MAGVRSSGEPRGWLLLHQLQLAHAVSIFRRAALGTAQHCPPGRLGRPARHRRAPSGAYCQQRCDGAGAAAQTHGYPPPPVDTPAIVYKCHRVERLERRQWD